MRDALKVDIERYEAGEIPSASDLNTAPRLEEWQAQVHMVGKLHVLRIEGDVYGDGDEPDGYRILSAPVAWFDRKQRFIRTLNRVYALGQHQGEEIPLDGIWT
ncbi:hypothetical protein ACVWZK_002936 [Bradyrhizobium sp. GM0.4]